MSQFPANPNQDDAELLERHLLAHADDGPDAALDRFRREQARLIQVTERAVAALRGPLSADATQVERTLIATKKRVGIGRRGESRQSPRVAAIGRGWNWGAYPRRRWVWVAAAMLVVAAGGVLRLNPSVMSVGADRPVFERIYTTTTGQQASITLLDGTRVTLAPHSTLRLTDFGPRGRSVILEGEAYFDVAHARAAPFIVQTGAVHTQVLGTGFSVRRYPGEPYVRVAVLSGKVSVTTGNQRRAVVIVPAGYVANATDSSATVIAPTDMASYTGWLNGRLVFHNAPTPEVLSALTRWYGYEFRVSDPTLTTKNLTVGLSTESAQAALATLKIVLDVDMTFDGATIFLAPRQKLPRETRARKEWNDNLTLYPREVGR